MWQLPGANGIKNARPKGVRAGIARKWEGNICQAPATGWLRSRVEGCVCLTLQTYNSIPHGGKLSQQIFPALRLGLDYFSQSQSETRRNAVASHIRPWDPEEGISPNTGIYRTGLGASVVTITRWPLVGALSITGFAIYILRKRVPRPKQAKAIPLPAEAIAT